MNRRSFLSGLSALGVLLAAPATAATTRRIELQRSAVAGFQYHEGEKLWASLRDGDELTLVREAENKYDNRAVRVEWQGHKLGYIPRVENASISHLLDNDQRVRAEIVSLQASHNPWDRVALVVHLVV